MNKGYLQAERAEVEAKKMDTLRYAGTTTIKVDTDNHEEEVAELVNQDETTVAYVSTGLDRHMDLEIMKRWNAYPAMLEALKAIEAKLHDGQAEDGSEDGDYIQDVRNLRGNYIEQLQELAVVARGAIAIAAK